MKISFIKTIEEKGIEALSLIVAIAIWQLVADRVVQDKFLLPSFYDVITSFFVIVKSGLIFDGYIDKFTSLFNRHCCCVCNWNSSWNIHGMVQKSRQGN